MAYKFMQEVNRKRGTKLQTWQDLHAWSVDQGAAFWEELFVQQPIIHSGRYERVVDEDARENVSIFCRRDLLSDVE